MLRKIFKKSIRTIIQSKLNINKQTQYLYDLIFSNYDDLSIDDCILYIGARISVNIDTSKILSYVLNLLQINCFLIWVLIQIQWILLIIF